MPEPVAGIALVTGAPGWLGTRLVARLAGRVVADGAAPSVPRPIRCLVLPDADASALETMPDVTCVRGDVTRPDTLAALFSGGRGATVFHCAGVIHPKRVAEFHQVNAIGTSNVLAAAARAGVRRFIHTSSNSPFGANPSREHVFTEAAAYHPYMGYGRSKTAAEQAVIEAGRAGLMETVIVRAPWFYGPGQPPRQTQFFTMIRNGGFPLLGDGGNRRSMTYIDNLCEGLVACERHAAANGEAFWIADERSYSMNEIVDTVETVLSRDFGIAVTGKRLRVPAVTADIARACDRLLQSVGLYDQRVHVLSEMNLTIACSIDKARQQLGYRPGVALEEGMRRSIEWVLSKGMTI